MSLPELAEPLEAVSGALQFQGTRVHFANASGRAGKLKWFGDFRWETESKAPAQFRLKIPVADAAEIERLLLPTLKREQSFLARTLRSPVKLPDWLSARRADGSIEIGTLTAAGQEFDAVSGRLQWAGSKVVLSAIRAKWAEAAIKGKGAIDMSYAAPAYRFSGSIENWPAKQGSASAEISLDAAGIGRDLLAGLHATGSVQADQLGGDVRGFSGDFELQVTRSGPRMKFTNLEVVTPKETFQAQSAAMADGRIQVDLLNGRKQARMTGFLQPLQFELVETRAAN